MPDVYIYNTRRGKKGRRVTCAPAFQSAQGVYAYAVILDTTRARKDVCECVCIYTYLRHVNWVMKFDFGDVQQRIVLTTAESSIGTGKTLTQCRPCIL